MTAHLHPESHNGNSIAYDDLTSKRAIRVSGLAVLAQMRQVRHANLGMKIPDKEYTL
jgi:hypothetical protein